MSTEKICFILLNARSADDGIIFSNKVYGSNERKVIDLQLASFNIDFFHKIAVLGEHSQQWQESDFTTIINDDWSNSGTAYSLYLALASIHDFSSAWVVYSDILFRPLPNFLNDIPLSQSICLLDSSWNTRNPDRFISDSSPLELVKCDPDFKYILNFSNSYPINPQSYSEYTGISRFSHQLIARIIRFCDNLPVAHLKRITVTELLSLVHSSYSDFKA